jgi:hypothetical protein
VSQHYATIVKGTELEDTRVIIQFLKSMVGQRFTLLNYFKEIPVSFDAVLLNVENQMAEFSIHEYQAKVIESERKSLIRAHGKSPFREDIVGEAFYVSAIKKRAILCKFWYANNLAGLRRFVRVQLDKPVEADLICDDEVLKGNIKVMSLGGAALEIPSPGFLSTGLEINLFLKLPDLTATTVVETVLNATVIKVTGEKAPYSCVLEFHVEKYSQQQLAHYINQRQVEIIRELKNL